MSGISFGLGGGKAITAKLTGPSKKPKVSAFDATSDDENDNQDQGHNPIRQRTSQEASAPPSLPASKEPSQADKQTADKLAQFVAKNGRQFEEITRQRNPQGGVFKFLFDTQSPGYQYYLKKVEEFSQPSGSSIPVPNFQSSASKQFAQPAPNARIAQAQAQAPAPNAAAPQWIAQAYQRAQALAQPGGQAEIPAAGPSYHSAPGHAQPLSTPSTSAQSMNSGGTSERKRKSRWQDSGPAPSQGAVQSAPPAKDDSVAAMERFAAEAAAREQERQEKEAAMPLLNETSFDRRRVMAVYKEDGTRGHHMQDFIPKEELAKLLAKSGTAEGKAQAEAIEAASRIQSDNIGHKLLSQMGWKEGQGLGASAAGIAAPVSASSEFGGERRGLGAEDHTAVQQGDDEFEVYRKRMMLGYKHRPNPLGNPRKNYY